jgi:hypothetical protein
MGTVSRKATSLNPSGRSRRSSPIQVVIIEREV